MFNKRIEKKIDELVKNQEVQTRMIESILEIIDQRQSKNNNQKEALSKYIDSVSGILEAKGAPVEFINSFKNLLGGQI